MNLWAFLITNSKLYPYPLSRQKTGSSKVDSSPLVRVVGTEGARRAARFTCYRSNTINQGHQLCDIMPISPSQLNCQRKSITIGYQMVFRAFFAAIRGVWAGFHPPKTAMDKYRQGKRMSIKIKMRLILPT